MNQLPVPLLTPKLPVSHCSMLFENSPIKITGKDRESSAFPPKKNENGVKMRRTHGAGKIIAACRFPPFDSVIKNMQKKKKGY